MQSSVNNKNSNEYVKTIKDEINQIRNKPVMGRKALLKKAKVNQNDSRTVHELITEKYNEIISHYRDKSFQRRVRTESSDCSNTAYSSSCSPLSISSISTPGSMGPNEKSGFRFPSSGYSTAKSEFRYYIPSPDINIVLNETDEGCVSNDESEKNDLGFLASTDDGNMETSAEEIDESAIYTSSGSNINGRGSTTYSEYDPTKFLLNAIGDVTHSSLTCGNFGEENHASIGSSNISALVSRADSFITTSKTGRSGKTTIQSTAAITECPKSGPRLPVNSNSTCLDGLMKELSLQNEILFQVSKALTYCKATKKFDSGIELLEAERILLTASCTKEALVEEIYNIENNAYEDSDNSKCCGEITISDLTFHSKDCHKTDDHRDFIVHFLVIISCGTVVQASEVVTADDEGKIHVTKKFVFSDLAADFAISVCIYAMKIGNKVHQNQNRKSNCPSPKKIFLHLKKKKYKVFNSVNYIKTSSFSPWGKYEIRTRDLSKAKNNESVTLKLQKIPLNASLTDTFTLKINSELKLTNRTSGFLTIGTDNEHGCAIWNRRWCVLAGTNLTYWNYPSEETSSPFGALDLRHCLDQRVQVADRSVCARPRTLVLSIKTQSVKKYRLSADDGPSLERWYNELNSVVSSLRVWNHIDVHHNDI
ncbi:hypothetical protein NQ317_007864 [Molorchus minor]|uniref:PH domain-containing protein n=1 Tax=Molorchus minor TaxID=1323400 RepID=A0ABQ9IXD1_9CUCU|nr:hypothetical protein NQ317_007864 [Molorchus minor]